MVPGTGKEKKLGTDGYRVPARKKILGTDGYRPEKKFSVPGISQEKNFGWYRENFHLCRPLITTFDIWKFIILYFLTNMAVAEFEPFRPSFRLSIFLINSRRFSSTIFSAFKQPICKIYDRFEKRCLLHYWSFDPFRFSFCSWW